MIGTALRERPAADLSQPVEDGRNPWRVVQFVLAAGSAVPLLWWGGLSGWPWDHKAAAAPTTAVGAADPVRIQLSRLGINGAVDPVKTDATTSALTPPGFGRVGWAESSSQPGTPGPAVFIGHSTNASGAKDVFSALPQAKVGDSIEVTTAQGKTVDYVVTAVTQYQAADVPMDKLFASDGRTAELELIAPTGSESGGSFAKDVVVYADMQS